MRCYFADILRYFIVDRGLFLHRTHDLTQTTLHKSNSLKTSDE